MTAGFRQEFEAWNGMYARADAVVQTGNGTADLFEVKSSNRVKDDHIKDACFQKICIENSGLKIERVFLVHLNGDFVREGTIDPEMLLVVADITEEVEAIEDETAAEIEDALEFLAGGIDRDGCDCLYESHANRCDAFGHFNPDVPEPSIHHLPRLGAGKRRNLVDKGILGLDEIPGAGPAAP